MTRRVLIVSPHFPPVNAPDCQRVRMSLPYLRESDWEAHVLSVEPDGVEGFKDPDLLATIPSKTSITRVPALPARYTRPFGFGGLWLRAGHSLRRAGDQLLANGGFDLVYFSTTIFSAMTLGPRWRSRFGIPYILDIQDPWVSDYYQKTGVRPPGGRLRYAFAQWTARRAEPRVIREASHIISVSHAYPEQIRGRYPDVPADRFTVLPFGAPLYDVEVIRQRGINQSVFDPTDGLRHWVYLGRGGRDMAKGLRGLFMALAELRKTTPETNRLRLHFIGTSYAANGRAEQTVTPVAIECGVGDLVEERTDRIPYLEGQALLRAADVVLIVGSDDPAYSASKVYPCVMSGRPVLAITHKESAACEVVRRCRAGLVVTFDQADSSSELASRTLGAIVGYLNSPLGAPAATDWDAFTPYTAREMARRQCELFVQGSSVHV